VAALRRPALVITSTADGQWPRARYDGLHLPVEHMSIDGASHWGLVLSRTAISELAPRVVGWLDALPAD
jgi:hypothetical protein